jgi:hypothetical protein
MGRLWVECGNKLHVFLTALFEFDDEGQANMDEQDENPFTGAEGDEFDDDYTTERNGDSQATRLKWIDQLKPGTGRWTVHMSQLGISRVFYDRVEAQIFIYDTFCSARPNFVSLFNSNFLYVGSGEDQSKVQSVEQTLKVTQDGLEPESQACCIYVENLPMNGKQVPFGFGPLESHRDKRFLVMPESWREIFYRKWNEMEEIMIMHLKCRKLEGRLDIKDLPNFYQLTYEIELSYCCETDQSFSEALVATYPLRLVYFPSYPGSGRHAFLWEHVRSQIMGKCHQVTKPVTLDGWKGSENEPEKLEGELKKGVIVIPQIKEAILVGFGSSEIQTLDSLRPPHEIAPTSWQDVVLRNIHREVSELECNLCAHKVKRTSEEKKVRLNNVIEVIRAKLLDVIRIDEVKIVLQYLELEYLFEDENSKLMMRGANCAMALRDAESHSIMKHEMFGALQIVQDRLEWNRHFLTGRRSWKVPDKVFRWQNQVRKIVNAEHSSVIFLNPQGEYEDDEFQQPSLRHYDVDDSDQDEQ